MKMKYEHKRLVVIVSVLLIFIFIAQQQGFVGRSTGVEFETLDEARSFCEPGKSIWSKSVDEVIVKYALSTTQPPTYIFHEACSDGNVCCNLGSGEFKKMLFSLCTSQDGFKVTDDLCEPHECETDAACIKKVDEPNNCGNPFWEPNRIDLQGKCTNYRCVYTYPKEEVCEDWQLFVQDYKWYIGAGIIVLLLIIMIVSTAPKRRTRRRR